MQIHKKKYRDIISIIVLGFFAFMLIALSGSLFYGVIFTSKSISSDLGVIVFALLVGAAGIYIIFYLSKVCRFSLPISKINLLAGGKIKIQMQGGQVHDLDLEKNIDSFYRDKEEYDLILKKKNNKFIISTRDIDKPDDFRSYVDKEMPIGDSTDDLGNRYQIFRKKRVE